MKERLSANLGFLWADLPLLDRIAAAARAGFKAVELHWPYSVPAASIRAACAEHEVLLLGINTPIGSREGDFGLGAVPEREEEFAAAFETALDYCLAAGGTSIHVMAGNVPNDRKRLATETFLRRLQWAEAKADPAGIRLLIEPLNRIDKPDYFLTTVDQAAGLLSRMAETRIKVMFDCYHVGRETGDVIRRLRQYKDRIGHIQIAAVPSRAEPDEGELNYSAIFAAIEAIGYDGFVGCEYLPRGQTDDGLGWIDKLV